MEINDFFSAIKTPVTILHVLSVVVGMGAALIADILFAFYSKDKKLNSTELETLDITSKLVLFGLGFITLTGAIIFLLDPAKYLASVKFLTKMTIVVALLLNGLVLHKYVWKHLPHKGFLTVKRESVMRKISFASGAISGISWISVFVLGVIESVNLSYASLMTIYFAILALGITTALLIEQKKFEGDFFD